MDCFRKVVQGSFGPSHNLITPLDLYEARAILLGRMGRHEHALELYVYKLGDFAKAEE